MSLVSAMLPLFGAFMLFMGCICSLMGAVSVSEAFGLRSGLRRIYLREAALNVAAGCVAFALAALAFA